MFFARNLYTKKIYDVILIIIDKTTKHAMYITVTINLKPDKFIDIL